MTPRSANRFFLMIFTLMNLSVFALEPNAVPGKVFLKNGEVLQGLVAPLGGHANSATVFQSDRNSKKSLIPHSQIERVEQNEQEFIPAHVPVGGGSAEAYLEMKAGGPVDLYRAHYFAPRSLGKNNTVTALQSAWVVSTPFTGLVNLGQNPDPKELARLLQHPLLEGNTAYNDLDDASLVKAIEDHNTAVRSALTGIGSEEHRNDR